MSQGYRLTREAYDRLVFAHPSLQVLVKAPGLDRDALMERLETQLRIAAALLTSGGGAAHAPAADSGE